MKKLNLILFISTAISLLFIFLLYEGMTNEIGDVKDGNNFHNSQVYQYYQASTKYKGGRKAIRDYFLKNEIYIESISDGWITIRFVVDLDGKIEGLNFYCIDNNYNKKSLTGKEEKKIQIVLFSLKEWVSGTVNEKRVNSIYQITLNISKNKVINVF